MADYAERYAEKQARILSGKIKDIYKQAAKEVDQKLKDFQSRYAAKEAHYRQMVHEGKLSMAWYQGWQKGQVFTGKLWQQKLADITNVYVNADKKAKELIHGTDKNVFCESANYTAKDINNHVGGGVSFTLYNPKTVERLIKDSPKLLPEWKINEPKDYAWNEKRVLNAVTQGIIQGESIAEITKRLSTELATKNAVKMNMFARTAITGSQNAGRIEQMREAKNQGVKVRKQWMTVGDDRVRDAHDEIDGDVRDLDEPFETSEGDIMYPGDPSAAPELVYNCRCTLNTFYSRYD